MNTNGRSNGLTAIVAFVAGVLTSVVSMGVIARPAIERVADERAAVVEARISNQLMILEQNRQKEYQALREEISQLRRDLISLVKEVGSK